MKNSTSEILFQPYSLTCNKNEHVKVNKELKGESMSSSNQRFQVKFYSRKQVFTIIFLILLEMALLEENMADILPIQERM
jgi:hypothetical protein